MPILPRRKGRWNPSRRVFTRSARFANRARAYPVFLPACSSVPAGGTPFSRWWDTPRARRQEAGRNDVGVDATRAPLARDDAVLGQLRQMAGHRAPGLACGRGERADGGEASAGAVGEADEVLQRPVQMPADGAVEVEGDGDE